MTHQRSTLEETPFRHSVRAQRGRQQRVQSLTEVRPTQSSRQFYGSSTTHGTPPVNASSTGAAFARPLSTSIQRLTVDESLLHRLIIAQRAIHHQSRPLSQIQLAQSSYPHITRVVSSHLRHLPTYSRQVPSAAVSDRARARASIQIRSVAAAIAPSLNVEGQLHNGSTASAAQAAAVDSAASVGSRDAQRHRYRRASATAEQASASRSRAAYLRRIARARARNELDPVATAAAISFHVEGQRRIGSTATVEQAAAVDSQTTDSPTDQALPLLPNNPYWLVRMTLNGSALQFVRSHSQSERMPTLHAGSD